MLSFNGLLKDRVFVSERRCAPNALGGYGCGWQVCTSDGTVVASFYARSYIEKGVTTAEFKMENHATSRQDASFIDDWFVVMLRTWRERMHE